MNTIIRWIKIYFGFAEDPRPAEGWLSWQHLLFVTLMAGAAVFLAVRLGKRNKNASEAEKKKTLRVAAVLMLGFELLKIWLISWRNSDPLNILSMLPLFLCSIQLIMIPAAAFGSGRVSEIAADFVFVFGGIGCIGGTYLAGNYFGGGPVLRFDAVTSVITHCISGFASIYVVITGLAPVMKKNIKWVAIVMLAFEALALTANHFLAATSYENNYMFLTRSAGTPFEICNTIVGGVQVFYTIFVGSLYFIYMALFLLVFFLIRRKRNENGKNR